MSAKGTGIDGSVEHCTEKADTLEGVTKALVTRKNEEEMKSGKWTSIGYRLPVLLGTGRFFHRRYAYVGREV